MAELTARRLVVFQPNVAWVDRRLAALALPAMKMMTSREPPEKYKAMMILANSVHESDVSTGHTYIPVSLRSEGTTRAEWMWIQNWHLFGSFL